MEDGEVSHLTHCPDCNLEIDLDGGEIGDYLECDACACELIIKSVDPPKLEEIAEEK